MTGRMVIHVGGAPAPFAGTALYLDGATAELRAISLQIDEEQRNLMIEGPGLSPTLWPLADIRTIPDQADRTRMVLAHTGDPVARMIVEDPETIRLLRARCPDLGKRPRPLGVGRLLIWAGAAVGSVALIVMVLVPLLANQLAERLPPEGEAALGDATLEQVRRALNQTGMNPLPICDAPEGIAALAAMTRRLSGAGDVAQPLKVSVLDHELVNAFALPGGRIVLFRGLIDAAQGPDEVAAVLAHEIGHVAARDPTRIALRSAGSIGVLGLLLGDFAGGAVVLFLTERLIQATYTQQAEAAADDYALTLMQQAEIAPGALARFFEHLQTLGDEPSAVMAHFMAHPALGDRIAKAAAATAPETPRPALDADAWRALQRICAPSDTP
ncbi:M48 family metallopeptidase [Oceaniglobus ichthyenteri]|uniref:M48 family metallopeptidase n=1 Tax=Oceaniglobus ichthyenteri TaxID=2136177 RepID=UPI000D341021|nr:M48 family metallopeptidase [Oceaniglobus ichthyenteri]